MFGTALQSSDGTAAAARIDGSINNSESVSGYVQHCSSIKWPLFVRVKQASAVIDCFCRSTTAMPSEHYFQSKFGKNSGGRQQSNVRKEILFNRVNVTNWNVANRHSRSENERHVQHFVLTRPFQMNGQ